MTHFLQVIRYWSPISTSGAPLLFWGRHLFGSERDCVVVGSKQTSRSHVDYNIVRLRWQRLSPAPCFIWVARPPQSQPACQVPSQDSQCQAMMEPILGLLPQSASMQSDLPAPWGRPPPNTRSCPFYALAASSWAQTKTDIHRRT